MQHSLVLQCPNQLIKEGNSCGINGQIEVEMEQNKTDTSPNSGVKAGIESLSKDELINKYKGVLNLAKKAKQAKDELAEENRVLKETLLRSETQKEADKKALLTMKETLEQFTEQKLQLSIEVEEIRHKSRSSNEELEHLRIENESLRRQMDSLTTDNETLLNDIDAMENQLKQVKVIGVEQKKHLELLELEVNRLKERDCHNASLEQRLIVITEENKELKLKEQTACNSLEEMSGKYKKIKEINSEQRQKFNALKDRFVDVYRKLMKLKECKRILLETQHEYSDAVSKWQSEIIRASRQLCEKMQCLQSENDDLKRKLKEGENNGKHSENKVNLELMAQKLHELGGLTNDASKEYYQQQRLIEEHTSAIENERVTIAEKSAELEAQKLEYQRLAQELNDLKIQMQSNEKIRNEIEEKSSNQASRLELEQLEREKIELQRELEAQTKKYEQLRAEQSKNETNDLKVEQLVGEKSQLQRELKVLNEKYENFKSEQLRDQASQLEWEQLEREKAELQRELEAQNVKYDKLRVEAESEVAATKKSLNSELHACRQNYEALVGRFELKEREHADLLGEMRELNEALKARGDVISRQEEKQQKLVVMLEACLSEKEQSIESKNHELQKLNTEIEACKSKIQELEATNARSEEHIAAITEELQSLKQSGNTYDTQSDAISISSNMSRADELNRLREVDENYEERYNKLRTMAVKLKKKLQEQTAQTNELMQQIQSKESIEKELEECKAKLHALEDQKQLNESLQTEIKKLKSSRKQANVLSLEIEAAEKSLSEVSTKLNSKTSELNELNAVLQTKESTIVQLRKEIAILEASKSAECDHAKELKAQIDLLQTQIKDAVHGKQVALDNSKDLEYAQERFQLEIEDLRLQLAQSATKQETILSELRTENTQLNSKLQEMETLLSSTQSTLKSTTRSLEDMRIEYMEYKVKAQAVLRKNQSKDTTHERELEEEMLEMRKKSQLLEEHAQTLSNKVAETEKQLEILKEDNECLTRRNDELHKLIEELRIHNDVLLQEQRTLMQTQQDALRQQRQQLDNVEIYHKEQLETMEHNYQRQIEQLKNELTKSVRQPTIIGAVNKVPPIGSSNISNEQHKVNELLLMEREDAEGSEEANATLSALAAKRKISNDSSSRRSLHDFMPLDELLNAPLNTLNSETVLNANNYTTNSNLDDTINVNSADSAEHFELLAAKERLQIQESRVRHLTALLAENEQDLAKLTQMNDMLKEELRRQERSVEREQHMNNLQNSEYLKNVFIKFITLNSVDERTRLVPVLNTILKLSRSETEMLNCVAKGQKVSESNTRSWSNFLPSWGGGGNSGN